MLDKQVSRAKLRRELVRRRTMLTDWQRADAHTKLCQRLIQFDQYQQAQHICFYLASETEASCANMLEHAWQMQKNTFIPYITDFNAGQMEMTAYTSETSVITIRPGLQQVAEPTIVAPQDLDLMLVPLVGFDYQGNRLGMGGGFYDRYLSRCPTSITKVGLAYACQEVDNLPTEPWDIPLDFIITENSLIDCRNEHDAR